jgi:protein-S-isoprenylcysteine O-methyltransferase Ste14
MPIWLRAALFIAVVPPWYVAMGDVDRGPAPLFARALGVLLMIVGGAILLWCARDFALKGRGTPAPYDAPRMLVTAGLYEYVRNPMYVGVLTAIAGQALWHWSNRVVGYWVSVLIVFHLVVVLYEEPGLRRIFGDEYDRYRKRVPRWIPRLRRDRPA